MTSDEQRLYQSGAVPVPTDLAAEVVVSPDTQRRERIPPGQSRTRKWPVLDAFGTPEFDPQTWQLRVWGQVKAARTWNREEFAALPRTKIFADFHCVTRWSRLGNLWEGVATRTILQACEPTDAARFVILHGADGGGSREGWTTNLPLDEFLAPDALLADRHDGTPLTADHGGPVRAIVPRLYAWKSAKWLIGIELVDHDRPGFWERGGYHDHGDPWTEERFRL